MAIARWPATLIRSRDRLSGVLVIDDEEVWFEAGVTRARVELPALQRGRLQVRREKGLDVLLRACHRFNIPTQVVGYPNV